MTGELDSSRHKYLNQSLFNLKILRLQMSQIPGERGWLSKCEHDH